MRRVVTGHDAHGKSIIVTDGASPHVLELAGMPGLALINLWVTDRAPAANTGSDDAADRPVVLEPPARGTIFRVVDFPPDRDMAGQVDRSKAFTAMGAGHAMDRSAARHPGMHKTNTVDYALVLDGRFHTAPWLVLVGLFLGLAAGAAAIWLKLREFVSGSAPSRAR